MKSKKIIFAIFAFLIFAFAGLLLFKKTNIFKNNEESSNNQINDVAVISQNSNEFVFVGDDSYLIKGKLTDEKFRDIYEKLPDTLYQLEFNDRIFAMDKTDDVNDMTFSLIQENSPTNLDKFQGTGEQENLIKYLKLAVNGKATYPKISSLANRFESLIDPEEFHTKYADYFIETSDNYGISALPSGIKLKLIEFFNSDEGKNYRYRTKGNQTSRDLMWSGELTGLNKKEMAILLNHTGNNLEDRYMLLVYALPDQPRAQQYYLVYN